MKITYFIRDSREGNYSIEQIFNAVGKEISKEHTVSYYYVDSNKSKLHNLLMARKAQGDINHITGDVNWLSFGLDPQKTILTIHDLGHFEHTLKGIKNWIYGKIWLADPMKRAKKITAISSFTKDRIRINFSEVIEKTVVIHNPVPSQFVFNKKVFNTKHPRILQIGSMANKNLHRLIEAVKGIECTLVLLGKSTELIQTELKRNNINHEFHFNINEKELVELYSSCDMLFFASTHEGFGMPILEGQSVGCPVLTSSVASMPEVAGVGGALFVDPLFVESIREGINRLITDTAYREEIIAQGRENIKKYSLTNIAQQYLTIYQEIAKQ